MVLQNMTESRYTLINERTLKLYVCQRWNQNFYKFDWLIKKAGYKPIKKVQVTNCTIQRIRMRVGFKENNILPLLPTRTK